MTPQTTVAVIGAGAMGAGIAQVAAQAGHGVLLYDTRSGAAAQAIANIDKQLGKRVAAGKLAPEQHTACIARWHAHRPPRCYGSTTIEPIGV